MLRSTQMLFPAAAALTYITSINRSKLSLQLQVPILTSLKSDRVPRPRFSWQGSVSWTHKGAACLLCLGRWSWRWRW